MFFAIPSVAQPAPKHSQTPYPLRSKSIQLRASVIAFLTAFSVIGITAANAQSVDDVIRADPVARAAEPEVTYNLPNNRLTAEIIYYTLLANMQLQRGHSQDAYKNYIILAKNTRDPRYAELAYKIGLAENSPEAAVFAADLLKELAPNAVLGQDLSNQILIGRGFEQIEAMQYRPAYNAAKQLLIKSPNHPAALSLLGESAERLGLESEALAAFEQLVKVDSNNPESLNALGYFLADRNIRLSEASKLINKAHKAQPNSGNITDSMAWLAYREGRLSDAMTLIETAVSQSPQEDSFIHQAEILVANNQRAQAIEVLRDVYATKPLLPLLRDTMERVGISAIELRTSKPKHEKVK